MMIENDVRITRCRRILPGARIGDDVIISAGAVVGGDVPPQTVGVGGPAKIIRRCFDAVTITL